MLTAKGVFILQKKVSGLVLVSLCLVALSVSTPRIFAGSGTQISDGLGAARLVDVAAGLPGVVGAVWQQDGKGGSRVFFSLSGDNGATWAKPVNIGGLVTGNDPTPKIAYGGRNMIIVYSNRSAIYYVRSADGGLRLSQSSVLAASAQSAEVPEAVFSGETVHFAWASKDSGGEERIYYMKSTDSGATWSKALALSGGGDEYDRNPSIGVAGETVTVVYSRFWNGREAVYAAVSYDGGTSWLPSFPLSRYAGWSFTLYPTVATYASGIYVVWGGAGAVYLTKSLDGGKLWSRSPRPIMLDENGTYMAPRIAADENGLHVVSTILKPEGWGASRVTSASIVISASTDGGFKWSVPEPVAAPDPTNAALAPSVASSGGRLFVAWEYGYQQFVILFLALNADPVAITETASTNSTDACPRQKFCLTPRD